MVDAASRVIAVGHHTPKYPALLTYAPPTPTGRINAALLELDHESIPLRFFRLVVLRIAFFDIVLLFR